MSDNRTESRDISNQWVKMCVPAVAAVLLLVYLGLSFFLRERSEVRADDVAFSFGSEEGSYEVKLWESPYDGGFYLFLPSFCDGSGLTVRVKNHLLAAWDGAVLRAGGRSVQVRVMQSAGVATLFVTTESGSLEHIEEKKGNREKGTCFLVDCDGDVIYDGALKYMKSRGNVTFEEDKKPYQISLKDRADLLGEGPEKNYVLLANRQDRSLLRDRIMYDLASDIGLEASPLTRPVDLYVNGEYRGAYLLSSKVEVSEHRIVLEGSGKSAEPPFLTVLEEPERFARERDERGFLTAAGQAVVCDYPEEVTAVQLEHVRECFESMEKNIREGRLDEADIDMESFAKKYIIEEFSKNIDAMATSQYFYRSEGDSIHAGPVWDYDKSLGNLLIETTRPVNFHIPEGIYAATVQDRGDFWYHLYSIPEFRELVEDIYTKEAGPAIRRFVSEKADTRVAEIYESARLDYYRWDPFEDFKYGREPDFDTAFMQETEGLWSFMEERDAFLTDIWTEGRQYDILPCDPDGGEMYVRYADAVYGRKLREPRDPRIEGKKIDCWVREDTGEVIDFDGYVYDGVPFTLKAVYRTEE